MPLAVPDILSTIVARKREELAALLPRLDALLPSAHASIATRRGFRASLEPNRPAIIAEVKKASPSKGVFVEDFQPAEIARSYEAGGAAALSVLTDQPFFQGSLEDLESARASVSIPILRKDFTIHEAHIHQAAAHGADAILLIAAILSTEEMARFRELAESYAMDAIVEVHDDEELRRALDSGPAIIGVNNRNLHTFEVTLETSIRLAASIPDSVLRVSESGIFKHADLRRLEQAGYSAFLVGEHLMRSGNATAALRALRGES